MRANDVLLFCGFTLSIISTQVDAQPQPAGTQAAAISVEHRDSLLSLITDETKRVTEKRKSDALRAEREAKQATQVQMTTNAIVAAEAKMLASPATIPQKKPAPPVALLPAPLPIIDAIYGFGGALAARVIANDQSYTVRVGQMVNGFTAKSITRDGVIFTEMVCPLTPSKKVGAGMPLDNSPCRRVDRFAPFVQQIHSGVNSGTQPASISLPAVSAVSVPRNISQLPQ